MAGAGVQQVLPTVDALGLVNPGLPRQASGLLESLLAIAQAERNQLQQAVGADAAEVSVPITKAVAHAIAGATRQEQQGCGAVRS